MYHFIFFLLFTTTLLGQITPAPAKEKKYDYNLSVAALFQQEGRFLKEWIEYHKSVGVSHFFLYNNNSKDNFKDVLQPYIEEGVVELIDWPSEEGTSWVSTQGEALKDMIKRSQKRTKWLALIDIDEFIVPYQCDTLTELLEENDSYSQVVIMWRYFGTSHVQKIPDGKLLLETLLYRQEFTPGKVVQSKAIVKPRLVVTPLVHECEMLKNTKTKRYDEGVEEYPPALIHHYWTRDIDFLVTVKKERQERLAGKPWSDEKVQEMINLYNEVYDETMLRYRDDLYEQMGF